MLKKENQIMSVDQWQSVLIDKVIKEQPNEEENPLEMLGDDPSRSNTRMLNLSRLTGYNDGADSAQAGTSLARLLNGDSSSRVHQSLDMQKMLQKKVINLVKQSLESLVVEKLPLHHMVR